MNKIITWRQNHIAVKRKMSHQEACELYNNFSDMIQWNYEKGLVQYHPIKNIISSAHKWFVQNDLFLLRFDIFDLAMSLLENNSKWVFIIADNNKIIEGTHRFAALQLLEQMNIISDNTSILSFPVDQKGYDFLWTDLFESIFEIDGLSPVNTTTYNNRQYYVVDNQSFDKVSLLYHRLTYSEGKFGDYFSANLNNIPRSHIPFIKFDMLIDKKEAIELLKTAKQHMLPIIAPVKQKYTDQELQTIYKHYVDFIKKLPLQKIEFDALKTAPFIHHEEIKKFQLLSQTQIAKKIEHLMLKGFPFIWVLLSDNIVANEFVETLLLFKQAIKKGLLPKNFAVNTVIDWDSPVDTCLFPGIVDTKMILSEYHLLNNNIQTTIIDNITYSIMPGELYGLYLSEIVKLFRDKEFLCDDKGTQIFCNEIQI